MHILAQWLFEQLKDGGKLVSITGVDGFAGNNQRLQAVDDLLACLDDSDTAAPSEIQKAPDKPVEKNSNGKSKGTVKKKHTPTR